MPQKPEPGFHRSLSLFDATAIVVGSMIGSGIFIVSANMSRQLGSPGWLLVVWAVTGLMTIIAALSYGELAGLMPKAGGQYVYLREAYNPLTGFLYGWTLFLVIQTGTIAAVAMAFAKFTGLLIPWFSESHVFFRIGKFNINAAQLLAIASILFLSWNNNRGIEAGKKVQNSFTVLKVALVILFIVIGLFFASNRGAIEFNSSIFWDFMPAGAPDGASLGVMALVAAMGTAMVGSLFSSDAWNNITFASEEIKNPHRNIALSLILGTGIVTIFYILANIVYLQVLPLRGSPDGLTVFEKGIQYATNDRLGTAAMQSIFGESAALLMAIFIMISTFGCNNGLILAGSRTYYAMAKDGLFFRSIARLNPQGVPANGLWFQAAWASLLCLSGTYSDLLDYVVFAVLIFYVLTIAGVIILRKKWPDRERKYKAFGYPVFPIIYILLATFVMVDLLIYQPTYTWPGLVIVLIGIPVFYLWKKRDA
jgi:APA family basic amino acid/polyamine antiporter